MTEKTNKNERVGVPSKPNERQQGRYAMTEQAVHEAWAHFTLKNKGASSLMHMLVARMDRSTNAVVASHSTLAKMLGVHERSIANYLNKLAKDKWIQIVRLGAGQTNAYVVNSMVAWNKNRETLKYAQFTAQVIAKRDDQTQEQLEQADIRRIGMLVPGEIQVPQGLGAEPPSQPSFEGMEAQLPTISDRGE